MIIKITDNLGKTMDRYTVYFEDGYMLMMFESPLSPQGVCISDDWKQDYIDNDNGKELRLEELPKLVQKAIQNFEEE